MATLAQLRAAFGSAWHTNADAIYDLLASDGGVGAGTNGAFAALTASGALTVTGATLLKGNVDIGDAITDTVGFYGTTKVAQGAAAGQAAAGTTNVTTTTPWGFATSTQGNALCALADALRTALVNIGIIKGAA